MNTEIVEMLLAEGVKPRALAEQLARKYSENTIWDAYGAYIEAMTAGWAKGPGLFVKFIKEGRKPKGKAAAPSGAKPKPRENWQAYQPVSPAPASAPAAPMGDAPAEIAAAANDYLALRAQLWREYLQNGSESVSFSFCVRKAADAKGGKTSWLNELWPGYIKEVSRGEFGAGASFADYVAQAERPPAPQPAPGPGKSPGDEPQAIGEVMSPIFKTLAGAAGDGEGDQTGMPF